MSSLQCMFSKFHSSIKYTKSLASPNLACDASAAHVICIFVDEEECSLIPFVFTSLCFGLSASRVFDVHQNPAKSSRAQFADHASLIQQDTWIGLRSGGYRRQFHCTCVCAWSGDGRRQVPFWQVRDHSMRSRRSFTCANSQFGDCRHHFLPIFKFVIRARKQYEACSDITPYLTNSTDGSPVKERRLSTTRDGRAQGRAQA